MPDLIALHRYRSNSGGQDARAPFPTLYWAKLVIENEKKVCVIKLPVGIFELPVGIF